MTDEMLLRIDLDFPIELQIKFVGVERERGLKLQMGRVHSIAKFMRTFLEVLLSLQFVFSSFFVCTAVKKRYGSLNC